MAAVLYQRQRELLEFIQNYIRQHGYSPTLKEMAKHLKVSSPATVHEHLRALERKGVVRRHLDEARGLEITSAYNTNYSVDVYAGIELPLLGYIQAGSPLEPYDDPTASFRVSSSLVPPGKSAFVLRVKGDSMIEDGIFSGDYVILIKGEEIKDGDVVVALLQTGLATLKRIYHEGGQIKLMPANSQMEPIYATEVQVQGRMVALVRKYL